jgi:hypothetical protein
MLQIGRMKRSGPMHPRSSNKSRSTFSQAVHFDRGLTINYKSSIKVGNCGTRGASASVEPSILRHIHSATPLFIRRFLSYLHVDRPPLAPALSARADAVFEYMKVRLVIASDRSTVVRTGGLETLVTVTAHTDADAHLPAQTHDEGMLYLDSSKSGPALRLLALCTCVYQVYKECYLDMTYRHGIFISIYQIYGMWGQGRMERHL